MRFNPLIPELSVEDIERTIEFYVGVLHFKVEYERPEDRFAFLSYEEIQIMFEQENGHWDVGVLEHPYGRGMNLEMTASDVEDLYNRILEHGIRPFRELNVSHYRQGEEDIEQREFLIQDPDGYLLRFTD